LPEGEGFESRDDYDQLVATARSFLASRPWCRGIKRIWFVRGFKYLSVFYCEIEHTPAQPPDVWVIVGDVPPAYMPTKACGNGVEAVLGYVGALSEVIENFNDGKTLEGCIPILSAESFEPLELNEALVKMLGARINAITTGFLSLYKDEVRAAGFDLATTTPVEGSA